MPLSNRKEREQVKEGEQSEDGCGYQTPLVHFQKMGELLHPCLFRLKKALFFANQLQVPLDIGITR